MKAVISNRIYVRADKDEQERLKSFVTYRIEKIRADKVFHETVRLWSQINKDIISIPTGCEPLLRVDELIDKRIYNPVTFPKFKFELREDQQEVYDKVTDSCIVNAQPSWGKTFTGIALASKLGQKTLIITHTVFLREQWEYEIEKTLGFKPDVIGSGKFEYSTPVVVSNIQTLVRRFDEVSQEFGTLILDEAHHAPASTFFKVIDTSKARYKIGLTATMERKDGYHVILPHVFSSTIYKPKVFNTMFPEVLLVDTGIYFDCDGSVPWANRVTELIQNPTYVHLLLDIVGVQIKKGHKVLVLSDRNDILKYGAEILEDKSILVIGETDTKIRNTLTTKLDSDELDVVWGNLSIFKEGISIPPLSCLVLATPINNDPLLEQIVGRICRIHPGKLTPQVVDLRLEGGVAKRQALARQGFYMHKGWEIKLIQ